jgi:microcystin-dependent protein
MSFYSVDAYPLTRSKTHELSGRVDVSTSVGNIALVMAEFGLLPPIGNVSSFAGSEAPNGYLLCNGQEVSRATYEALFLVIGETYGSGDGLTTFNVPNLVGRIVVCRNASDTDFDTLGETGGSKTHTLTIAEMPSHDHTGSTTAGGDHNHTGTTGNAGSHNHTVANTVQKTGNNTPDGLDSTANEIDNINTTTTTTSTVGDHNHTISNSGTHTHGINSQGGSQPHTILQPYMVMNYIIKY